jgi:ATP-dependent protease ClpP protease subunit
MNDDIMTRLRTTALEGCSVTDWTRLSWDIQEAADEIELLRKLAHNLYEETKRCGTLHDIQATWDYEQWLEDND